MASSSSSSSSPSDISDLVARIQYLGANDLVDIQHDPGARRQLLQASRELTAALQEPADVVTDVAFSGCRYAMLRVGVEMGLFEQLASAGQPLTAKQLASECDADEALVLRIGRVLVGMGFAADAVAPDGRENAFVATDVSRHMTRTSVRAGMKFFFDQAFPVITQAPTFFRKNGFRIPQGPSDGLFQFTYQTDEDCYTHWSGEPGVMETFNAFAQGGYFGSSRQMLDPIDWFPYDAVCLDGFDEAQGEVSLVDVGGSKGYHIHDLLTRYPASRGRFVLQDLPQVIADIAASAVPLHPRVERQGHDFFLPQPVRHARTYMLQNVLHNWNDGMCRRILAHMRAAMRPGYSKLVVMNLIIEEAGVPLLQTGLDAWMLMGHGGCQRSPRQWRELLEGAGFEVVKFWMPPGGGNGVVEAVVPVAA